MNRDPKLPPGPWEVVFQGDVQEYFVYSSDGLLVAQTFYRDIAYFIEALPVIILSMPDEKVDIILAHIKQEMKMDEEQRPAVEVHNIVPDENEDQPDSGFDLEGRLAYLEAQLIQVQEDHAQTSQLLEQTQAERNVLQDQNDRLVQGEPDSEDTETVQPDHKFMLQCGCIPHSGADLARVAGCPVIFANKLLDKQREKDRQIKAALVLLGKIVEGEPLIGFREVKNE